MPLGTPCVPLPVTVRIPPGAKVPPAASEPLIRAAVVKVTDPRLLPEHTGEQGGPETVLNTEEGLRVIVVRVVFAASVPKSKLKVVTLLALASSDRPITRTATANNLGYAIGSASSTVTAHFVTSPARKRSRRVRTSAGTNP